MDAEISKGTWIGAGLLAIVAILGLAFAVYGVARSLVNNSSADFVKAIDSVGESGFNDYDGTIVSGLQVKAALADYSGKKIAILINTAAIQRALTQSSAGANDGSTEPVADSFTLADDWPTLLVRNEQVADTYNVATAFGGYVYVQYNALFDVGSLRDTKEGFLEYKGTFKVKDGTSDLIFNSTKANYKVVGTTECIDNGNSYNAKLIKDQAGTIVGLLFREVY